MAGELGGGTNADEVNFPIRVPDMANARSIAAGGSHTCVILEGGSVSCWGSDYYGMLGGGTIAHPDGPILAHGIGDAVSISTREYHTCALMPDGSVRCWGWNEYGQLGNGSRDFDEHRYPAPVIGIDNAVEIVSGFGFSCALLETGIVKCWGDNDRGELGIGTAGHSYIPVLVRGFRAW
jgi:hypothetical protein